MANFTSDRSDLSDWSDLSDMSDFAPISLKILKGDASGFILGGLFAGTSPGTKRLSLYQHLNGETFIVVRSRLTDDPVFRHALELPLCIFLKARLIIGKLVIHEEGLSLFNNVFYYKV